MSRDVKSGEDRMGQILDRQLNTEREGEGDRQARGSRGKGYGHRRSARKRSQRRMSR